MTDTAYERILNRLRDHGHVTENHDGARAKCPAHNGTSSTSLVIRPIDGSVLIYCHAGCQTVDVLAALQLQTRDLYDARNGAEYVYPDGRRVHRTPNKTFYQKGNTKGRALFHADRIGDAGTVYVPEGEKDVLAAESVGAIAVCPAMGAGKAHKFDWSPLGGRHVVVVADRDRPGRKHGCQVAELLEGIAVSVAIAEAAVGKDLADHIAAGLGLHELVPVDDAGRNGAQLGDEFVTVTLSTVTPEPVTWLWKDRLPAAKLVNLDGDPGLGKSTLALTFAAIVTTGGDWPDGTVCEYPGDVVLLSAEDGVADTIRPRADAAGADTTRIHAVQGVPIGEDGALRLPTLADIAQLRRLVEATHARLVIVDVLMAYLPIGTDSHKDQDIRAVLARLAALADATGATVLLLRHLNKAKGGDPLYRGGGSIGIVGAARAAMLVAPDPDNPDRRVLAWSKSNLAPTPDSLIYRLVDTEPLHVAEIAWDGVSGHSARSLLSADLSAENEPADSPAQEARDFITDYLMDHGSEVPAADVLKAGRKAGFTDTDLKNARARSSKPRIGSRKASFGGGWVWAIDPESPPKPPSEGVKTPKVSTPESKTPSGSVTPSFTPPSGPGRCDECGFHTETQGHRDTCSKHTDDDEPPF
jgi:hypothetical protein